MLKSLELFGFKSFADRTRFDFAAGITGVVGPNGSGKSNVVDAIKWILGDQSPKSLRGQEMTDVIFNGTSARKATGFAEATLTFDNTTRFLAIDTAEVQVGRRLWRNGDAEYLINNAPARLRDIRELLMGTGAGSAAYSIIEQGRVDQILQSNAAARRQVFEEAAGISLYKARRIESERRLQRVDQNLVRLTDIVDEMEGRLNATRSQAAKAAKYRELFNELKEVWIGLSADDYRRFQARMDRLDSEFAASADELELTQAEHRQMESRLAALDVQVSENDDELRSVERKASGIREALARLESTLQHEDQRTQEFEGESVRVQKQRAAASARLREVAGERDRHAQVLEIAERDLEAKRLEAAERDERVLETLRQVQTHQAELKTLHQRRDQCVEQASKFAERRRAIESEIAQARAVRSELESRLVRFGERRREWQGIQQKRQMARDDAERFHSAAEERLRTFHLQREQLASEQGVFQRTLAEQREDRSALQARKSLLEDLERREEGLSIGVKEILDRARTSDYPPWNQVRGCVADVLEVDLEHAGLLELALGSRAQLLVVDRFEPLVEYLSTGSVQFSGRVGFLERFSTSEEQGSAPSLSLSETQTPTVTPYFELDEVLQNPTLVSPSSVIDAIPPADSPATLPSRRFRRREIPLSTDRQIAGLPGVLYRMDDLVRPTAEWAEGLAKRLLSDTWVVETIETALRLITTLGRGRRFVTLQGELIEADGTLTVGSVREDSAPLSRKAELRRVKNDLMRLDFRITEEERRIASLTQSLTGVDSELAGAANELKSMADRLAGIRSECHAADRELERIDADVESVGTLIASASESEMAAQEALETLELESAELTGEMVSLAERLAANDQFLKSLDQQLRSAEELRNADRLELARLEGRLQNMRESRERLEQDQRQRQLQYEEAERRLGLLRNRLSESRLQWLNAEAERNERLLVEERFSEQLAAMNHHRRQFRAQRADLVRQESQMRNRCRAIEDRRHQMEIQHREIESQIQSLALRMEEEFQLTLKDVVESGKSAWATYRQELANSARAESSSLSPVVEDELAEGLDLDESEPSITSQQEASFAAEVEQFVGDAPIEPPSGIDEDDGYADARIILEERVNRLRRKLKHMGSVNTDSLQDLDELDSRFQNLKAQWQDLSEAKSALEEIIRRINGESQRLFVETFNQVRIHFQKLFRKAFGGGDGDVVLEDPNDVLDCGIDIVARPPGKELKSITLMSGGEKTLTAFALLLAIFQCRPSPYCVLDEVDAALDEANVERLTMLLQEFENTTQFLIITHKKPTMSVCDALYGVTMEEAGVSKRISVRFDDVSETGDLTPAAKSALHRKAA